MKNLRVLLLALLCLGGVMDVFGQGKTISGLQQPQQEKGTCLLSTSDPSKGSEAPVNIYGFAPQQELIHKRDISSKHFQLPNGEVAAILSAGPLHYQQNGQWKDIDLTLMENISGPYKYSNTTNLMQSFYGRTAREGILSVSKEGSIKEFLSVKMYWEGNGTMINCAVAANAGAVATDNRVVYGNVFNGIDAEFTQLAGKRKLNYIINSASALANAPANADKLVFSEDIEIPAGFEYEVNEKYITLSKSGSRSKYIYELPSIMEAYSSKGYIISDAPVHYSFTKNGNTLTYTISIDKSWILDTSRKFPIAIDPTTNYYTDGITYRTAQTNAAGGGAYGNIACGYSSQYFRSYASFNISAIPTGATVSSTVLWFNVSTSTGMAARGAELRAFLNDPESASYPTWASIYNGITNATNSPLIYFDATPISSTGWKNYTLGATANSHVQNGIAGGKFTVGFRPSGTYNGTNQYIVANGESATLANRPYLAVTYTTTSCVGGTASGPAFVVTNGTANLILSGHTGTTIQWQSSPNGATGWANVSTGTGATTASYTTAALANGTYYYRTVVTDGGSCSQTSNTVTFYVAASPSYCTPTHTSGPQGLIYMTGFDNNGIFLDPLPYSATPYYRDLTNNPSIGKATLIAGQYQQLATTIAPTGGLNAYIHYWIDFNNDGVFDNVPNSGSNGEYLQAGGPLSSFSSIDPLHILYFNVPSNAYIGTVRMRVRVLYNTSTADACSNYTDGQTYDFDVEILPSIGGGRACGAITGNANQLNENTTVDQVNITSVSLNGLTVTSNSFYNWSYSNMMAYGTTTLNQSASYNLEVEGSGYLSTVGAWIDWNNDGQFTGPNEQIGLLYNDQGDYWNFPFTVPTGLTPGTRVLMRVRMVYDDRDHNLTACNNYGGANNSSYYQEVEDYYVTVGTVFTFTCADVTNLAAAIGSPANGTAHHLAVTWDAVTGATGYDLDYSTSSSSGPWTNIGTVTGTSYDFNAGDNPNTPYYFRIRARNGSTTCNYVSTATPRYTAADVPATPTIGTVGSSSIQVTLANETPVNNPVITTYSIKDENTGLFVQANGSLGATEVFRTKAQWGTVSVTGLTSNTAYCFVAKAHNNDGHEVGGTGATLLAAQGFGTSGTLSTTGGSGPTNMWWSPSSCGSGGLGWNASNGCTGGTVGQSTTTPFCFLRSPGINCNGLNTVVMTFDISHSYFAALTTDQVNFNLWAPTAAVPTGEYIDAAKVNGVAGEILYFNQPRSCQQITVEFDLSLVTDKSAIMFYFNTYRPGSSFNTYYMWVDNVKFNEQTQTACATTTNCTAGTWTGLGGDNDWHNPTNWSCNTLPTSSIDVTIPVVPNSSYPVLASIGGNPVTGYTRDLNILAGANVSISGGGNTIEVGRNLTNNGLATVGLGRVKLTNANTHVVSGNITIGSLEVNANTTLSGNLSITESLTLVTGNLNTTGGTLKLKSNASTTAYINDFGANNGTLTGNVTVERYVANTVNGFHYVGAPVGGTSITDWGGEFNTAGPNNSFVIPQPTCNPNGLAGNSPYGGLFDYRESNVTTCYQSGWRVRSSGNLAATEGYAGIIPNGVTIDLTGTANTGNINSPALSRTSANGTSTQGMHMVSNPYPSALDWYSVAQANPDLDGTAYVWLTSGSYQGTYQQINALTPGSSFIGSSQGFFVEALSNGAIANFTNAQRVAGNNSFFRQGQGFDSRLILEASGNGFNDRTIVAFGTDFTHGYDREFDGKKMQSKGGVMTLYSQTNPAYPRQSTNALPNDKSVKVVPVGFAAGANGTFTFTADDLATFGVGAMIFLEDLKTGNIQNLMVNPNYTFTSDINDAEARFLLHFIPSIEWNTVAASCVGNDGSLVVDLGVSEMNGTIITWDVYEIVDANGQQVSSGSNANGTINLTNLAPGTYTVTLEHDGYTVVQDITVAGALLVDAASVASDTDVLENETITFSNASLGATSYVWDFGDGNTSTDANPAYSYATEGTYTVTLTATNGTCTDVFTQTITVSKQEDPTGIDNVSTSNGIRIYGYGRVVTVKFENWKDQTVQFDLYDLTGRKVIETRTLNTAQTQHQLHIGEVVSGYYFVRINGASGSQVARIFLGEQ